MYVKRLLTALTVPLLLLSLSAMGQNREVKGEVTDAQNGSPLPGVTLVAKGTTVGTVTTTDGSFHLDVPSGTDSLTVSYIGYTTQEVPVGAGTLHVPLAVSKSSLNEVVVIGYGTQQKKDLTGSVASIDAKDFQKGAITNPAQLIAGKLAGVSVTPGSGEPGAGSTILIRGLASLNGNNAPLIVVDGVPLSFNGISGIANPLSMINPDDIASITVLKDASAAAIYGSRASGGVILITTKRGKAGKPKFDFSTQFVVSKIAKYVDVLSPSQFRDYVNTYGSAEQKARMGNANTDWQKEIYQTGIESNNNLSVSGSWRNMPYRVSLGFMDQNGILKTDNLKRTTASIRLTPILLNGDLKVDINLNGTLTQTRFANQGAIGAAAIFDPTQPVHGDSSKYGGYWQWEGASGPTALAPLNPVGLLELNHNTSHANRSFGNIKFNYRLPFLPDLHVIWNAGYDVSKGYGSVHVPEYAVQDYRSSTDKGYNSQYLQKTTNIVSEVSLNYVKDIRSIKSNINATAGYGYYNDLSTNYSFPSLNSKGDTIAGTAPVHPYDKPENTLISYYGRLIYSFNTKYILTASLRTDGSSRFAPDDRWGVFPAVAFAWRINKEEFLKNSQAVSNLKLRLSYGVTGNQAGIGNYGYLPDYYLSDNSSLYELGGKFYNMYTPAPYVPDLTWEQTASTDVGLDYGFLNDRITGSIDYYYKKTKNLLDAITIPVGSNFTNVITTNIGNMTSEGIEFSIEAIPIQTKNMNWDVAFNIAYNKIKITRLRSHSNATFVGDQVGGINGATGQTIQIQSVDYTPYSFFVFKQVYDPKTDKPIEGLYEDANRDGIINEHDMYRYKSPFPPVILGFSTQLQYKKWSFSTTLRANVGNYMYNNIESSQAVQRTILNPLPYLLNGPENVLYTGFYNNQYQSDYYVQNASFLKMDNIGIGYRLLSNKKLDIDLSLRCRNAFTITKYKGIDPEIYQGIDNTLYPRPRIYTLGVNVGF